MLSTYLVLLHFASSFPSLSSSWACLLPGVCFRAMLPANLFRSSSTSSSRSSRLPAWMESVRKLVLPLGCPSRDMETGKVMAKPDPFGVKIAAGAEEVEARLTLAGSGLTPGAGAEEEESSIGNRHSRLSSFGTSNFFEKICVPAWGYFLFVIFAALVPTCGSCCFIHVMSPSRYWVLVTSNCRKNF